jgi:PmbA protein
MFDSRFAETLIDAALSFGAEAAEVYCCRKRDTEIMANNGQADSVNVKSDDGYGVRVLRDSRMGFASSNLTDKKAAVDLVREVTHRALIHSPDENHIIPEPSDAGVTGVEELYDPDLESIPLSAKIDKIVAVEKAAREYDSRIQGFGWLQYGDSVQEYFVCNSRGVKAGSKGTISYAFAYAIASDGKSVQTGTHVDSSGFFGSLSAEKIGATVARYAVRMLGAKSAGTGEYLLLLPPEASSAFLSAIAGMLSSDQVQKGKSPLRDRLGETVAAGNVSLLDDGILPGGLATSPYDSEGVPSAITTLIENGRLKSFLYDSYCAKKGNTVSTGNASRASYHAQPSIAPTNFYLKPGDVTQEDLIKSVSNGLYITEVSGLHAGINPTTADFSVPAKALVVRDGEFAGAVDGITISGNILRFFRNINEIATDLTWIPGYGMIGAPTISVSDTKVTGRQ